MGVEKNYRRLENRFSVQEVCETLQKNYGLVLQSSRKLGCSRQALAKYIERHPEAKKAHDDGQAAMLDVAEAVVIQNLMDQDLDAAKFVLSTIGKNRGYTTKTESELSGKLDLPGFTFREKRPEDQQ